LQYKIFVSYSTLDIGPLEQLKQQLDGTGMEVFIAEHSINPGEDLKEKISAEIETCDLFVVLWSKNAEASEWVSQEVGRAGALNKNILPIILTEGLSLPGFIRNLKYIPVYENPKYHNAQAREIILKSYQKKREHLAQAEEKKGNETLAIMGIGAFLLWAMTK
jgi:hypothetical protein